MQNCNHVVFIIVQIYGLEKKQKWLKTMYKLMHVYNT